MVIEVKNLRKPGVVYDSTKLAQLGTMIAGGIRKRTNGQFVAKSTISGNILKITVFEQNPETGKLVPTKKEEQTLLAGRIGSFLNKNGISSDIRVT